jgi:histidinol-phosphate aminotransferase
VLSLAARAFVENDGTIGSLDPSYSLYKTLAAIRDVEWTPSADCTLFLLTNPNAPTGVLKPRSEVAAFAKKFKGVLIVDEAYADFASENCMPLAVAEGNRNLIVMRTFSKSYSLAGLRVGYCVGPVDLIDALYKVKDSYNVDAVAQAVALAALKDRRYFKANVAKVKRTRKAFVKELEKRGWDVMPSESNFVFARPPEGGMNAAELFAFLKKREIYVRYFPGPKTGDRLRITIGTDAEMAKLLEALDS